MFIGFTLMHVFMTISKWKNPFGLHGFHKNISALQGLRNQLFQHRVLIIVLKELAHNHDNSHIQCLINTVFILNTLGNNYSTL